jgi:adenylate kinase
VALSGQCYSTTLLDAILASGWLVRTAILALCSNEKVLRSILGLCLLLVSSAVDAYSARTLIVLIGPPASGKTTQAQILQKERGMLLLSVEDLIAQNRQAFERFRHPEIQGVEPRLDPVLDRLIEERLRAMDRSKGVILDGYPASKAQGDHLALLVTEFQFAPPVILQLNLSDAEARGRARKSEGRDIEQDLKDYHRELDFARLYFSGANIHEIDASKPLPEVTKQIRAVLASK